MAETNSEVSAIQIDSEVNSTPRWYVVHTYSGYENKVMDSIRKTVANRHLEEQIVDVTIPLEHVTEIKANGTKKVVDRKIFPGYVLVQMILNEDTWYVVRNIRGVTGFVGPGSKPVPLTEEEMKPYGLVSGEASSTPKVYYGDFKVGDYIRVVTGPWEGKETTIQSVNDNRQTITIIEDMFGRETKVEINFSDIEKI